ncbi:sp110 nuclear body protein isoform X2 [Vicugna pacos]|uniref:Sp110 nuclear body protein isoform X2 n=1 Tax=Vicugna pacos TaxID=30538 RepID=A0ABM5DAL1_VICPA
MAVSASRRFTMTRALEEALLQHFICQKLEIAYAINKPFPFLEGLRDNLFITERLYRESLEACGNLVPVSRVVYNILTKLQTTFNLSFLELLFSQINLREYPNLMMTLKSFERVVTSHGGQSRIREIPLEASANPSRKCSLQTLLPLLPACQHPAPSCPSCAPSVSEPKAPAQRSAEILNEPPSPAGLAVSLSGVIEEGRLTPVARDDSSEPSEPKELQEAAGTPSNKKGKKRKRNIWSTPKRRRQKKSVPREISDDISEIDEGKRPQEPPSGSPRITRSKEKKRKIQSWSSSKKRQKKSLPRGAASPGHRVQEERQVMNQATQRSDDSTRNPYVMIRAQKARPECDQTPTLEEEKKGKVVCSSSTRCQRNILAEEKPKEDSLDFHAPKLPVTCGKAKGILYKEKMKQGSSEKCIQNEKGVWFTPREFEMEGKRAQSRYWKRSVLCGGKSLEQLMKNGLLLCPPRSLKREEDPKECMVCCRGGLLLCCDTCPRAFHENCHIPPTEAERSPWSCTFCRMKERSGSQQCHGESELLTRQMEPEDQLKCEFLLLKAYCHPQSSFFAETPPNIRDYGEPFKEAMWLNLVKERLAEKVYTVAWFLRDMRLIFRNHQAFYKASDFGQVGLDLEAEFEKDLKEVLVFHKASENSFQAPP